MPLATLFLGWAAVFVFLGSIFTSTLTSLVYVYFAWNNGKWKKEGLPHITPKLVFGNTPNVLLQKRNGYYDIQDVFKEYRGEYCIAGMYSLRKPTILALDPLVIRSVFQTEFHKFSYNDFGNVIDKDIDPILGHNPFMLNGNEWKEKRSDITPAFTVSRLRSMYPLIDDVCKNLKNYIERELKMVGSSGFDARDLSGKFTTDSVSNCLFGVDAGALKTDHSVIREKARDMLGNNFRTTFLLILSELCPKLNKVLRIPFVSKDIEVFFANLMRQAVDHRRATKEDKADVLQYLLTLQEKRHFNDVELVANAITFFVDGYETSSVSMALILFEIGRNARVQDKLRTEIMAAEHEQPMSMDAIADLQYLDQVVYEALRLNAPAPVLMKKCIEDCDLPLTRDRQRTFTVRSGTSITIPVLDIHRDPANYENPLEFHPERFDGGRMKEYKDQGKLLVFGMGPRMCLGQRFAMAQMKAAIVEIVKNFRVTVNEKTQIPLVMSPGEFLNVTDGGVWVNFDKI